MEYDFNDGWGLVPAHKHPNGGGWVSDDSCVHPLALVDGCAKVSQRSRVGIHVKIRGPSTVLNSTVEGCEQVYDSHIQNSIVSNAACLSQAHILNCTVKNYKGGQPSIRNKAVLVNSIVIGKVLVSGAETIQSSHIAGDVIINTSKIEGMTLKGRLRIDESTLKSSEFVGSGAGIFVFRSTCENSTFKGIGFLSFSSLKSGASLQGNFSLLTTHVYGDASLRGFATVIGSHFYDKASIVGKDANSRLVLERAEVFGEALVEGSGKVEDLYHYFGLLEVNNAT